MIFAPPRHGKSELASRRLPALYLGQHPDREVILTSYSADLASRMNRDVQRTIDSPRYKQLFPATKLAEPGSRSKTAVRTDELFEIVGNSGSLRSAGVGGGIIGMGGALIICDDLIKNHEEAHSQTIRDKTDEWYTSTLWTRQAPGASILVMMTRWHSDDLAGRLIERMKADPKADQWTVLRLPGIADGQLHGADRRQEGEALWPKRFPREFLDSARVTLGSAMFAGNYQGTPVVAGGNHFKEHWFKRRWQDAGNCFRVEQPSGDWDSYAKSDCTVFATCDPASSAKATADNCAILVWAVTPHNDLLLLDMRSERLGLEKIVPKLLEVSGTWRPTWIGLEADGFQVGVVNEARKKQGMPPVRALSHEGKGKLARAHGAIVMAESGKIVLPAVAPWIKRYLDVLTRFTGIGDEHDDEVDCTSYAVSEAPSMFREAQRAKVEPKPEDKPRNSAAGNRGLFGRGR